MRAVILAAGRGSRMGRLTAEQNKSLLEVGGRPLLGRIVDSLVDHEVRKIVVATGYLAHRVQQYLLDAYPEIDFEFVHNPEFAGTNNARTLALALDCSDVDDDVLVIESDLVYDPSLIAKVLRSPHRNVALVAPLASGADGSVAHVTEGRIEAITPASGHPGLDADGVYKTVNIYKFSAALAYTTLRKTLDEHSRNVDRQAYYETVLGSLIVRGEAAVHVEVVEGEAWAELDDPMDLARARYVFEPDSRPSILERARGGHWNYPVLDFTELRNMHFPTPEMHDELAGALPDLTTRYGSSQSVLDEKLSYFVPCRADRVILLNGLSQIYPLLREWLSGKRVLIPNPTFGEYSRVFPEADRYQDHFGFDPAALESSAGGYDAVVIVNPNNPTGTVIETSWIAEFARANPDLVVIVDESFVAFSTEASLCAQIEAQGIANLVVLRSLSKELGVPGLRLGYLFSVGEGVMDFVRERTPIWNAGSVAEAFLELLLKHRAEFARSIEATLADRSRFSEELREVPIVSHVREGGGNFVVVQLEGAPEVLGDVPGRLLRDWGIYVKDISERIDDGSFYLRLAVRLPEENRRLAAALSAIS